MKDLTAVKKLAKEIETEMFNISCTETSGFSYDDLEDLRKKYEACDIRMNAVRGQMNAITAHDELEQMEKMSAMEEEKENE